jgi:hypothetical protein
LPFRARKIHTPDWFASRAFLLRGNAFFVGIGGIFW